MDSGNTYYDTAFYYKKNYLPSLRSAQTVVPLIMKMLDPRSVVDVGCGIGTWTKVFQDAGVRDVLGLDFQESSRPLVTEQFFRVQDLRKKFDLKKTFDLAISLEVAEHIESRYSKIFVENLTRLSKMVLFSAAIPKQEGEHHINEQWHSFWINLFEEQGYVAIDLIRPYIILDNAVSCDYRQNMILFVHKKMLQTSPQRFIPYFDTTKQLMFRKNYAKLFSLFHRAAYRINNQVFRGLFNGIIDNIILKKFFGDIAQLSVEELKKQKVY